MLNHLRYKSTILFSIILLIFLSIVCFTINFANFRRIVYDADNSLKMIARNIDRFPQFEPITDPLFPTTFKDNSSEIKCFYLDIYENKIVKLQTSKSVNISTDDATKYASKIICQEHVNGFINNYRYLKLKNGDFTRIIFLDCYRNIAIQKNFTLISIFISLFAFIIAIILVYIFSNKIIKPFAQNYDKQKSFITNASHEIKTPLTIISTNADILELEYGSNESIVDIKKQIKYLTNFTNQLVYLSKMEENEHNLLKSEIPLSDIISETLSSFITVASSQNKHINTNIEPILSILGNDDAIRQLVSILIDNAIKYSLPDSTIDVNLVKQGHNIIFSIENESIYQIDRNKLNNIFDRFYRMDESHNSNIKGNGIGLSIAKIIANHHNAKISASVTNNRFKITIIF